ncbi:MAG TPA: hypothetical protein PL193_08715 [Xanthobacteraceae bacterium]|nr:hypothetical protein [Xanthobacteraceae bacterium]
MPARMLTTLGAALALSMALSACADVYYDRRDAIHMSFGDANASNIAVHTIDPWPRHAANRDILTNGEKIQPAIQRYKQGKVTPPRGLGTSSIELTPTPAAAAPPPQ